MIQENNFCIKVFKWSLIVVTSLLICGNSNSYAASSYQLVETIDMVGYDMIDIDSDGQKVFVLDGGSPVTIKSVDRTGLLNSFTTPGDTNTAIVYNGNMIVFANSSNASNFFLRGMNPTTGSTSARLSSNMKSITGLGYDGSHILVFYLATGTAGILTAKIIKVDSATYTPVETISVTIDTGTTLTSAPVKAAWHENNLFVAIGAAGKIYRFDNDMNLVEEIPLINIAQVGITFIQDDLFVSDREKRKIYRYEKAIKLSISPPYSKYVTTQNFDLTLIFEAPDLTVVNISATLDGSDVTTSLLNCVKPGTIISGGQTFRCPAITGGFLGTGIHKFSVTFDLSDGSSLSEDVSWIIVENTEP